MSAEVLRQAAALMRERAEAATHGRWYPLSSEHEVIGDSPISLNPEGDDYQTVSMDFVPNREHIASWHPAVALAVADWLDTAVIYAESLDGLPRYMESKALAVARAYLEDQP